MNDPLIVYEDSEILLINKPPGLVVNRSQTVKVLTLQDWIEKKIKLDFQVKQKGIDPETIEYFKSRSGVVHRLDKDTSGIMVVSKTPTAFKNLLEQFYERKVKKEYLALLHGRLQPEKGAICLPLARKQSDRERFTVSVRGKTSETSWRVRKFFEKIKKEGVITKGYQGFSFVSLFPKTGRTHQIRVHMSHLNHPLVGDQRYLGKKRAREDKKWCKRQFLHAFGLKILHPSSGKVVSFEAPLFEDLSRVLELLE